MLATILRQGGGQAEQILMESFSEALVSVMQRQAYSNILSRLYTEQQHIRNPNFLLQFQMD